MEAWNFVAGGAALGLIAGCWDKLKAFAWRLANIFVQRVEIPSDAAHEAVVAYLVRNYRRSKTYDRLYGAHHEYFRSGRYGLVPFEEFGVRNMIFWNRVWPICFANAVEAKARSSTGKQTNGASDATKIYSTLTFVRGTLDVEELIREACRQSNAMAWGAADAEDSGRNRFVIHYAPPRDKEHDDHDSTTNGEAWYEQGHYRLLGPQADELGRAPLRNGSALANLIFPERVQKLIHEIELWRANRQWYMEKGIPWKRGWLLYGPPGTGKTALARAFAEDLNLPIYVYNLAELDNYQLYEAWRTMQVNIPCIALLEDIDNVFHGRENIARKQSLLPFGLFAKKEEGGEEKRRGPSSPLTFDCLLNCLDGVDRCDGVFTIISTNDVDKVDPALGRPRRLPDGGVEFISTRPGRIDKAIELTYMEPANKKQMAKRILGDYPEHYRQILRFIDQYPEMEETPAQFQERCAQIALACFWQEQQDVAKAAAELKNQTLHRNGSSERTPDLSVR